MTDTVKIREVPVDEQARVYEDQLRGAEMQWLTLDARRLRGENVEAELEPAASALKNLQAKIDELQQVTTDGE